ncbi:hypothetical protein [Tardiphaga sp. OK245]|uniref:hypothetical protein n=1 Tax=Tardiphaga sp. OK245 TaxID=1855306 RepID=UPI0008A76511|nr:hypothetical protein [Tardiphaga sp. OK245]SEH40074.1 hypothetical protein SAMN05216367_0017 [Tardiphaga sp. OK245]
MVEERILKRFEEMLKLGDQVLATRRSPSPGHITSDFVDVQLANQWFASSLNLLVRVLSESSEHYKAMQRQYADYPKWPNAQQAYGILKAAHEDVQAGALFEIRSIVAAELFDDFLEQGKALLAAGYFAPAAVVVGSVLEDGLRKLCAKHSIALSDKPKLDGMNSALAKASIYNVLTQKKITALAGIRNDAAHGKWDTFSSADVESMMQWTADFMQKHFS